MTPAPLLVVEDIDKSIRGVAVLNSIRFQVISGRSLALIGEAGAGKSTLLNILDGSLRPDEGTLQWEGRPYTPNSPRDAATAGIAFVHREPNLFGNLTVAENLHLTDFPILAGLIRRKAMRSETVEWLRRVGSAATPDTPVERLSAGERQLIQIAKALRSKPKLLVLFEPTTALTAKEAAHLFELLRGLQSQGVAIIYVSSSPGNVLGLCHDLVILRNGQVVGRGSTEEFTVARTIALMTGRNNADRFPKRVGVPSDKSVLSVFRVSRPNGVRDITFQVRSGEILGIAGRKGSGRTELARVLVGLDPMSEGSVALDGVDITALSLRQRIRRGMAFLTENCTGEGLFMEASILDNIVAVSLAEHVRGPMGWLDHRGLEASVRTIRETVRLPTTAGDARPVKTLSRGDQQKVVLAKWLLNRPRLLLLDEPTRGIDVGAKVEIYALIQALADQGAGVLLISSKVEELTGICDRILVMGRGEICDEMAREAFDRERILRAALRDRSPAEWMFSS